MLGSRLEMREIAVVALLILLLNLPFGYWRAGVRKFSPPWWFAVHLPVPLAIGLRFAAGLGLRWATLPVFVAAFFTGQLLGGRYRRWRGPATSEPAPLD